MRTYEVLTLLLAFTTLVVFIMTKKINNRPLLAEMRGYSS